MRATTLTIGALCGWLALNSIPPVEAATAYRCTLPDGRVVYTELRPPDAQCQPLSARGHVRSTPPAAPPADDDPAPDETEQDDEVEQDDEADDAERRRQACATARRNLELLESGRPVSRVDADGERVVLDAEQRAAALARTRESIAEWCDEMP